MPLGNVTFVIAPEISHNMDYLETTPLLKSMNSMLTALTHMNLQMTMMTNLNTPSTHPSMPSKHTRHSPLKNPALCAKSLLDNPHQMAIALTHAPSSTTHQPFAINTKIFAKSSCAIADSFTNRLHVPLNKHQLYLSMTIPFTTILMTLHCRPKTWISLGLSLNLEGCHPPKPKTPHIATHNSKPKNTPAIPINTTN